MKLTPLQIDFLERLRDGRKLGIADRVQDKLRQEMRRAGLAEVIKNPRRWVITAAGREALNACGKSDLEVHAADLADFYELRPSHRIQPGGFGTAALISCGLCGTTIDGMGGPGHGAVCLKCGTELIAGRLKGAVAWEDANDGPV